MAPLAIIRNAKTTDHDLPKSHPWNEKTRRRGLGYPRLRAVQQPA